MAIFAKCDRCGAVAEPRVVLDWEVEGLAALAPQFPDVTDLCTACLVALGEWLKGEPVAAADVSAAEDEPRGFRPGDLVRVRRDRDPNDGMVGRIVAYNQISPAYYSVELGSYIDPVRRVLREEELERLPSGASR